METVEGIRTYRLHCAEKSKGKRFRSLMAIDLFEPCAGCIEECEPEHCAKLSEWIFAIVIGSEDDVGSMARRIMIRIRQLSFTPILFKTLEFNG